MQKDHLAGVDGGGVYTPGVIAALIQMYRKHEAWTRRSGYAPMEWPKFKASRLANPLSRAAITKATGATS